MPTWTLAKKDLRLLLRDPRAAVVLLAMPLTFILVLGLSLGEGFGQKPDDRLRVSLVDLDQGYRPARVRAALGPLASATGMGGIPTAVGAVALAEANRRPDFPGGTWAQVVREDLAQTAGIRLEVITTREEAESLVWSGRRAAVIVFGPGFSEQMANASFLAGGINPFFHDGVDLKVLDAEVLRDPTQLTAASIIEQVAQGSLLRVTLPWMIGRAFEKIGDAEFVDLLSNQNIVLESSFGKLPLNNILKTMSRGQKQALGGGLQGALQQLFTKYNLTAKTWAGLTRSQQRDGPGAPAESYREEGGGLLKRGALRYQTLVPSYTVMFAFFLVLTVGWLFTAERRQGTLKRLRAAPLSRAQILLGKLVPCYLLSLGQGVFLLVAGRVVFGMSWGPEPWLLVPVVASTSLAAMGLALLVAAVARTETQVAIYGTLLVLVLAGLSGSLMGDRSLMPETMQQVSRGTPHAWALDAYRQLLTSSAPNVEIVAQACLVLAGFGVAFLLLAWWRMRLD